MVLSEYQTIVLIHISRTLRAVLNTLNSQLKPYVRYLRNLPHRLYRREKVASPLSEPAHPYHRDSRD